MVDVIPNKAAVRRWLEIPVLYDLDARLRMMEEFGPDYQQILTLSMRPSNMWRRRRPRRAWPSLP